MLTSWYDNRKYIYPAIMLIGFFMYLMTFVLAAEAAPNRFPGRGERGLEDDVEYFRHSENDFINAAESFNRAMRNADHRGYQGSERDYVRVDDDFLDNRYARERRRLDERRDRELNEYRDRRRDIQDRMSGHHRRSPEYGRLQRELLELDRRHAAEERRFEREFINMDANYSSKSW